MIEWIGEDSLSPFMHWFNILPYCREESLFPKPP